MIKKEVSVYWEILLWSCGKNKFFKMIILYCYFFYFSVFYAELLILNFVLDKKRK